MYRASADAAGNMTAEPGKTYTYDAENRMTAGGGVTYTYDGDGKRVAKSNGKLYWYGMSGLDALLETDGAGNNPTEYVFFNGRRVARRDLSGSVFYYFSNHLGSTSVITNASGTIVEESDYYPFGGERVVVNNDPNPYKFTGHERDSETGLDYFIARYYSSGYGRFLVPDPENAGAFRSDPQSWNAYGYVTNNSLNYIDPFGLAKTDANRVWVGEFHGEKDCSTDHGCLFWNEDAQQWESEAPHPRWPTMWQGMWHAFMLIPNGVEIVLRKAAESGSPPFGLSDADMLAIEIGIGLPGPGTFGRLLPKAARTFDNVTDAFRHLEKYHGVSSILASERLHKIKASAGLGPADDVLIDRTGGVWHSKTREFLGSLTEGGAKTVR